MNYNINKSNNQVPKGYKKTKVGVVPEDWEKLELNKIFDISSKKFNPKIESMNKKCIELEHLSQITGELLGFTNSEEQQSSKNIFKKGQILYGKLRPYLRKYLKTTFDGVCSTEIWVLNNKKVTTDYLFQFVQTDKFNQIANVSTGSKMPRADWKYMSEIPFIIPPLKEQQKIANILTTWDNAVSKQEELIKAKEELKKGLMQKLLTGKVRFKEFNDEWLNIKLGDILDEPKKEKVKNPENYELLTVKLHCQGIAKSGKFPNVTENGRPYYIVQNGELLIGRQNFHNGGFGISPNDTEDFVTSNAITHLTVKDNLCNLKFIEYYFSQYNFYKRIDYLIGGTGQKEISKKEFNNIKINLPSIKEQEKILEVLSLSDREIKLLKKELFESLEQKKGLMQKLLTGEVRVKV